MKSRWHCYQRLPEALVPDQGTLITTTDWVRFVKVTSTVMLPERLKLRVALITFVAG